MARRKKQKRWPQALPTAAEQIGGNFRNWRKSSIALPRKLLLNKSEIIADKIKNLFDGQQRDGVSPKLFIGSRA